MNSRVYEATAELLRAGRRGAVVTVIETSGSAPRKAGAKMLVDERGNIVGTVGGGWPEADLIRRALEVIGSGSPQTCEIDLSSKNVDENDMLCGGHMKAFIEPVQAEDRAIVLGGGHISRALCDILQVLGMRVVVTDDRAEFANPQRFPNASQIIAAPFDRQFEQLAVGPESYIVIVTRGHQFDLVCLENALGTPARYIAMVGSHTKFGLFRKSLSDKGFADGQLDRVCCPAGLDIGAETPEEIAVSIAAQIIQVRRGSALAAGTRAAALTRPLDGECPLNETAGFPTGNPAEGKTCLDR